MGKGRKRPTRFFMADEDELMMDRILEERPLVMSSDGERGAWRWDGWTGSIIGIIWRGRKSG